MREYKRKEKREREKRDRVRLSKEEERIEKDIVREYKRKEKRERIKRKRVRKFLCWDQYITQIDWQLVYTLIPWERERERERERDWMSKK